jgi:hypothetical protein
MNKLVIFVFVLLPRGFLNYLAEAARHGLWPSCPFLSFRQRKVIIRKIGRGSPQGFALRDDKVDSRQQSSGMRVGGELQLLALGHTWRCIYYVTVLIIKSCASKIPNSKRMLDRFQISL